SNSLLLRLFNSEFFNSWIAVSYLFRYPENIGIQHYLCNELRKFPLNEIEFFLPQFCHLLISRPTESVALESFLLDRCQVSTHIAILTFWYLQAYRADLSSRPFSKSFRICRRMFNRVRDILFADEQALEEIQRRRNRVRENTFPAMIGISCVMAAVAAPRMLEPAGQMAVVQGRKIRSYRDPAKAEAAAAAAAAAAKLHRGKAFSFSRFIEKATNSLRPEQGRRRQRRDTNGSILGAASGSGGADETASLSGLGDSGIADVEPERRGRLLTSHYFHSEMQFVMALVDISKRLCNVPRSARQSSLQAELTLLNHNLPADVCVPLWCPATAEHPYHHQVVRIALQDSVVLNSAEKVPYLLLVEVLEHEVEPDEQEMGRWEADSEPDEELPRQRSPSIDIDDEDTDELAAGPDEFSERMRTAAVMLAQLAEQSKRDGAIRERIIREMMALEEERILKMKTEGVSSGIDERDLMNVIKKDKDDPSAAVLRESWEMKQARIRASSPFGHHPNWRLLSVIVKTGDDLRQEQLALQLIREMQRIWQQAKVDVWVKYYRILVTSNGSGLMETIKNSVSIHSLKKEGYTRNLNQRGLVFTLYDYFVKEFGDPSSDEFLRAQDCFMRSLAGYSVVSYVLQLKDRHNGNVLLDNEGHLIHIDFGFMLSNSPGSVGFEMAPFKLPQEYLDILGGVDSEKFREFKQLLKKAFLAVRKSAENLVLLIEMMQK
ncbi:kinase-like domain-containing protein, partial [Thamnocephalis sphaerospora]